MRDRAQRRIYPVENKWVKRKKVDRKVIGTAGLPDRTTTRISGSRQGTLDSRNPPAGHRGCRRPWGRRSETHRCIDKTVRPTKPKAKSLITQRSTHLIIENEWVSPAFYASAARSCQEDRPKSAKNQSNVVAGLPAGYPDLSNTLNAPLTALYIMVGTNVANCVGRQTTALAPPLPLTPSNVSNGDGIRQALSRKIVSNSDWKCAKGEVSDSAGPLEPLLGG